MSLDTAIRAELDRFVCCGDCLENEPVYRGHRAIRNVLDLHAPQPHDPADEGTRPLRCAHCRTAYPCPTIRALSVIVDTTQESDT